LTGCCGLTQSAAVSQKLPNLQVTDIDFCCLQKYDPNVIASETRRKAADPRPPSASEGLSLDAVLDAAESELRRFGPAKTTVVDVARKLGVTHGSVYRYIRSKADLQNAVADRWLQRVFAPLEAIVSETGSAEARLRHWTEALIAAKQSNFRDDPEMFALYGQLAASAPKTVDAQLERLIGQIHAIIADGIKRGEFRSVDAAGAARAVLSATSRFHHPAHAAEWDGPGVDASFEAVWTLLSAGLRNSTSPRRHASKR